MRRYAVRCGPTENPVPWMEFWVGAGDKPKAAKFMMKRFPGLHVKGVFDLDDPEDAAKAVSHPDLVDPPRRGVAESYLSGIPLPPG